MRFYFAGILKHILSKTTWFVCLQSLAHWGRRNTQQTLTLTDKANSGLTKNVGHSPHTRKVKQMQEADENAGHCEFIVWSLV